MFILLLSLYFIFFVILDVIDIVVIRRGWVVVMLVVFRVVEEMGYKFGNEVSIFLV